MILMGIGVVLSFLQIITSGWSGIAGAIIGAIVSAYLFICIYSMYKMFKDEKAQRQTPGSAPAYHA